MSEITQNALNQHFNLIQEQAFEVPLLIILIYGILFCTSEQTCSAQSGFAKVNWIDESKCRHELQRCTRCAVTTNACSVPESRLKLVQNNHPNHA